MHILHMYIYIYIYCTYVYGKAQALQCCWFPPFIQLTFNWEDEEESKFPPPVL